MKSVRPQVRGRRANFPDLVKAAAFVRDRATCSFGGGSLWVADLRGRIDWCDHRVPASHGGTADLSNAISSCFECNHRRGNRDHPPILFHAGELTEEGYAELGALPGSNAQHLMHMKELDWTDWFLNRAFICVLWGAGWINQPAASRHKRDAQYDAHAALTKFDRWRSLAAQYQIPSPVDRGLAPQLSDDVERILWNTRHCSTHDALRDAMIALAPHVASDSGNHGNAPHCYDVRCFGP